MAAYFFDSSALVKYYVNEIGSAWVESLIDAQPPNEIAIAQITGVEVIAALSRRVRMGTISATAAAATIGTFRNDFQTKFTVLALTTRLLEEAWIWLNYIGCVVTTRLNWQWRWIWRLK